MSCLNVFLFRFCCFVVCKWVFSCLQVSVELLLSFVKIFSEFRKSLSVAFFASVIGVDIIIEFID